MRDTVGCLICGCSYSGIRKPGDVCGDLSYAKRSKLSETPPCPGICIPLAATFDPMIYQRAHNVIRTLLKPPFGPDDAR